MKTIIAFLVLVAFASSSPLKGGFKPYRNYNPDENNSRRMKYLFVEDEQGGVRFEDLTVPPERAATPDDVELYLYTRENQDVGTQIKVNKSDDLTTISLYDNKKDNYFIIHGWNNDYSSNVNKLLKSAILTKTDSNVFVVDWGTIANKLYVTSRAAVPEIGKFVGDFINGLIDKLDVAPKKINLIGHSLGAHVAGCAGAMVNGSLNYIAGLDPAGPLFDLKNTDDRLDETDAEFVQVVHTSGILLGFSSSIGHADYFPNGGTKQPGCGLDVGGTCAHSRAYEYYYESILHGGFNGPECESYRYFKKGKCDDNSASFIGSINVDKNASGDYYLNTNSEEPFSLD